MTVLHQLRQIDSDNNATVDRIQNTKPNRKMITSLLTQQKIKKNLVKLLDLT